MRPFTRAEILLKAILDKKPRWNGVPKPKPRRSSIRTVNITGAAQSIASPSEKRRSISICQVGTTNATVVNTKKPTSSTDGIQLVNNGQLLVIDDSIYGDLTCSSWYAFSSAGSGQITVIESMEI